ncbi:MAG: NlpC/P60 family protein [Bacteroidales bacterium]
MNKKNALTLFFFLLCFPLFSQIDEEAVAFPEDTLSSFSNDTSCPKIDSIINFALSKRGCKYKYGSAGPHSFDCSGLMNYTFNHFGIKLDRSSRGIFTQGKKVERSDLRRGDLVFFIRGGNIGHVGLVVEVDSARNFKFVHAATYGYGVRIDHSTKEWYAKTYAGARRIIECTEENKPYILPNDTIPMEIIVPVDSTQVNSANVPRNNVSQSRNYLYHRVRSGDTLYAISKKYKVSIDKIKKWNNLHSDNIRIDQKLKIYK